MSFWKYFKYRIIAVAAGVGLSFIGLAIVSSLFYAALTNAIDALYIYDSNLGKRILQPNTFMTPINDLIQRSGIIPMAIIAFIFACILPVFFILKDYVESKSIYTIMRLPTSKTYYYLDKLVPPILLLGVFWLMQCDTFSAMARLYISEVPAEKLPADVWMTLWNNPPARLLYPFEDPSHIPAAFSFLILVPATVILFVLAERSKNRGIFSGVIACTGIVAILMHVLDLPASTWVVPSITAIILIVGIWHINRIQIT